MSESVANTNPYDVQLRDPLSKETRAERRTLLGASAIGITIVQTGLVPSKISALGIEFNQADQRSLLLAVAAVIVYFLAAFLIYALSDFLVWRLTFRNTVFDYMTEKAKTIAEGKSTGLKEFSPQWFLFFRGLSRPVSVLRASFEFVLPVIIGIYAVVLLLRTRV